jgi:hypothetical protein
MPAKAVPLSMRSYSERAANNAEYRMPTPAPHKASAASGVFFRSRSPPNRHSAPKKSPEATRMGGATRFCWIE